MHWRKREPTGGRGDIARREAGRARRREEERRAEKKYLRKADHWEQNTHGIFCAGFATKGTIARGVCAPFACLRWYPGIRNDCLYRRCCNDATHHVAVELNSNVAVNVSAVSSHAFKLYSLPASEDTTNDSAAVPATATLRRRTDCKQKSIFLFFFVFFPLFFR